jgi:hypothetical protein
MREMVQSLQSAPHAQAGEVTNARRVKTKAGNASRGASLPLSADSHLNVRSNSYDRVYL